MHGVHERKDVKFIKDNNDRVRAKCLDLCKVQKGKKLTIYKTQGLRTKKKGLDKVIEKVKEQFAMLENYIAELLRTKPIATTVLKQRTMKLIGSKGFIFVLML
ncbi:hypothetical protein ACH5RR_037483 [Cinchona calisaya]|uniref:Uncharacterized protein n=1 Tax=Cinchona calisaya TaxID=153742 RepID=A0ABD2YA01_9GENT